MAVITIPFDYDERTHPAIVPICIADTDSHGNAVHRGWIDLGVVPVVDRFFKIAERLLADKFRASEIAEYAVHSLSRTHGDNLGDQPSVKVLNSARLYAVDQRAGGRRYRRSLDVELFSETLEALEDQYDLASDIAACETLDKIVGQLELLELHRVKEILPFMLRNAEGAELTRMFGQKRNTITKQFYRGMRKAAHAAGITWY
jgi:hypothetical protein